MMRTPRAHAKAHLDFIRGLPCLSCKDDTGSDAAHIRYGDPSVGKRHTGMGEKPHDHFTVPLCRACHIHQHKNEQDFWEWHNINPILKALALWAATGNHELGEQIVRHGHD